MNPLGLTGAHFINTTSTKSTEKLPWEELSKKIGSFAESVFKVITAPIKPVVYLALIPISIIVSSGCGIQRGLEAARQANEGKKWEAFASTVKKCALFGATFFFRPLLSSVGVNLKGGASYEWRNQIEKDLFVSGVPFKSDVKNIAEELSGKSDQSLEKDTLIDQLKRLYPRDDNNPTLQAIYSQLNKQNGPFKGVVIDVTEREELTPIITKGSPAETQDWNDVGILHINIPSKDMEALNVNKNVDLAEFGNLCRDNGLGVLVHCAKGIGRSAGVAITMMAIKKEPATNSENNTGNTIRPKKVSEAIQKFKGARAYGLNEKQELAVYESKVQALINDLPVTAQEDQNLKSAIITAFKKDNFSQLKSITQNLPMNSAIDEYETAFNRVNDKLAKDPKKLEEFKLARFEKGS